MGFWEFKEFMDFSMEIPKGSGCLSACLCLSREPFGAGGVVNQVGRPLDLRLRQGEAVSAG